MLHLEIQDDFICHTKSRKTKTWDQLQCLNTSSINCNARSQAASTAMPDHKQHQLQCLNTSSLCYTAMTEKRGHTAVLCPPHAPPWQQRGDTHRTSVNHLCKQLTQVTADFVVIKFRMCIHTVMTFDTGMINDGMIQWCCQWQTGLCPVQCDYGGAKLWDYRGLP